MKLVNFSGGLSTKNHPHLISENQSTVNINVDDSSIILKPCKVPTLQPDITFGADGSIYYFKGTWYSTNTASRFVPYNDWLYYYKGGVLKKSNGASTINAGLTAPTSKITLTNNTVLSMTITNNTADESDLVQEVKSYRAVCINEDYEYTFIDETFNVTGANGTSISISCPSIIKTILLYRFYNGNYYLVNTIIGNTVSTKDLKENIEDKPIISVGYMNTIDVRQYCYTYYRSTDDIESAPSEISDEISTIGNNITLTNIVAPTDSSVTAIKIYRVGGDLEVFSLVATVPKTTTTYTDTLSDSDVVDNAESLLTSGTMPPKEDLNCLTLFNSSLFGYNGSILSFSVQGMLDNWNPFYDIEFEEDITGIGPTANGLLVFLRNKTYILTGTSPSDYTKYLLSDTQGCIASVTIQYTKNTLVWLSLDGICASIGGDVQVISEPYLGKLNVEPTCSAFYDNEYYLGTSENTIVVSFEGDLTFRYLHYIPVGLYYNTTLDKFYSILNDSKVYILYTGEPYETFHYRTGWLTDGSLTVVKTYKDIYIYSLGEVAVTVFMNGEEVQTYTLEDGMNQLLLPSKNLLGYYIEFYFTGKGEVLEVEYKVEDRQNGR
ncbi:MAG: hypothetical protein AB7D38_12200 [Sulfurimonas sp.]|uniref:hypothetical protein n=1 Tax=Sulfurimonas sp. TaxID=2022749 RepID=UPI003D0B830A